MQFKFKNDNTLITYLNAKVELKNKPKSNKIKYQKIDLFTNKLSNDIDGFLSEFNFVLY